MVESLSLPRYKKDDLASFLGDLRSWCFEKPLKLSQHLGVSHTTILRYEEGTIKPKKTGYIAYLAYYLDRLLLKTNADASQRQAWLLEQVNAALLDNYAGAQFGHWNELSKAARDYYHLKGKEPLPDPQPRVDWGEAPQTAAFYGRDEELRDLKDLIIDQNYHMVIVAGIGGIGKTLLATQLAHEATAHFEYVIWRSLRNAPTLEHTLQELSGFLLAGTNFSPSQSLNQHILRLREFFQTHRCLIVLDNFESIMGRGDKIGSYHPGYEEYSLFLETIAKSDHQSCLLLTTREVLTEFSRPSEEQFTVRTYHLHGVPVATAQRLLTSHKLSGSPDLWQKLNDTYSGNAMALKIVAEIITMFFDGDIGKFIDSETILFDDIRPLLRQTLDRLSSLAHEVLYWLAIRRQTLSQNELAETLEPPQKIGTIVDSLQSLLRCSLIEKNSDGYYLPNMISEYVIDHLMQQVVGELAQGRLDTLHRVALLTTDMPAYIRETQVRLIIKPLLASLINQVGRHHLKVVFEQSITALQLPEYAGGFAAGNLLNLIIAADYKLYNADFSGLTIRQALLTKVALTNVNFSQANLIRCRFDNTFTGINTVALSRKGKYLALAAANEIRVWQLSNRQPYRILSEHREMVWDICFTQDEQHLFSRDAGGTIHRWDIENSRIELTIKHDVPLRALAVSKDDALIASGTEDGLVCVWDAHTGKLKYVLNSMLVNPIRSVAFSASAHYLAAGAGNGTVVVWELAQPEAFATLNAHQQAVTALCFIEKDRLLVSGDADGTLGIWKLATAAPQMMLKGHDGMVSALKTQADGALFISSSYDRTIKVWDTAHREPRFTLQEHDLPVNAIDLDETGTILVSGSYDRTVRLWDMPRARPIDSIQGLTFEFRTMAFSADSRLIAVGSSDYHVYLWNIKSGTRLHTLQGHTRWISVVAFHPDGSTLASGSYDRTIRIWDIQTGKERALLMDHQHWVICVCFNQDGQLLASGSMDGDIRLWSGDTFAPVQRLRGHEDAVHCIAFHPRLSLLASCSRDKTIRLWDCDKGTLIATLPLGATVAKSLCFATHDTLVFTTEDGHVIAWDWTAENLITDWQILDGTVRESALSSDGRLLATLSTNRSVSLWDIETQQQCAEFQTSGSRISTIAFDTHAHHLASGSVDGWGNIWDIQSGDDSHTFKIDRPYEGLNITYAVGMSIAQREMLKSLGAIDT